MKKLLILGLFALFLTSCSSDIPPQICSGCIVQDISWNNSESWVKMLHCKDTVYSFGPKGTISKYPTNNK